MQLIKPEKITLASHPEIKETWLQNRYTHDLLLSVINVSLQTVGIVEGLPGLEIIKNNKT